MPPRQPRTTPPWHAWAWWATAAVGLLGWILTARVDMGLGIATVLTGAAAYAIVVLWPRGPGRVRPAIHWWLLTQLLVGWACFPLTLGRARIDWSWFGVVAAVAIGAGLTVFIAVGLLVLMLVVPASLLVGGGTTVLGVSMLTNQREASEGAEPASGGGSRTSPSVVGQTPLRVRQRVPLAAIFPLVLAGAVAVQFGVHLAPEQPDMLTRTQVGLELLAILGVVDSRLVISSELWLWVARACFVGVVVALWSLARKRRRAP